MAARRWLLLLGSNLEDDAAVREALIRLNDTGRLERLTDIRRFPAYGTSHGPYYNVLAQWRVDLRRDEVLARIKTLEHALGRDPATAGRVDIDIDVLGVADDDAQWMADPHAVAKQEFTRAPVLALLREAGIDPRDLAGFEAP